MSCDHKTEKPNRVIPHDACSSKHTDQKKKEEEEKEEEKEKRERC